MLLQLVFTRSGTGALHMLGEIFPFTPASTFRFLTSNHNSLLGACSAGARSCRVQCLYQKPGCRDLACFQLLQQSGPNWRECLPSVPLLWGAGIRAYAKANNASFGSIEEAEVEEWLHSTVPLMPTTAQEGRAGASPDGGAVGEGASASGGDNPTQPPTYNLFAFPAYDNYAGVLYPLSWVKEAQARSNATHKWKVQLACRRPAYLYYVISRVATLLCMPRLSHTPAISALTRPHFYIATALLHFGCRCCWMRPHLCPPTRSTSQRRPQTLCACPSTSCLGEEGA